MTDTFPTVVTEAGMLPTPPAVLRADLVADVASTNPGYTSDLPGSLIEDIASTDVGAMVVCDSAKVDTVNSLTPLGANDFLLAQLGDIYGVEKNGETTTSVFCVFTSDPPAPGFVLGKGFTVSDGTYQYTLSDGGVLDSDGVSSPLFALATIAGSWSIPAGTVTQLVTSVPSTVTLTVNNPQPGTPAAEAETSSTFRSRVLQGGLAIAQGMSTFLKTILGRVSGVQTRLINVVQQDGGGWTVVCGGGDPYEVAYAIFTGLFDISTLVGSTLGITGATKANPGVITTDINHNYANGQIATINSVVGMTQLNGNSYTVTVVDEKRFSIGVNSSAFGVYVSGGVVTPNLRNIEVSLNDYPDTYTIPFVNPPQQDVTMTVTWNTSSPNFVSSAAVSQLGGPALAAYVNAIASGEPMNLFQLESTFKDAIKSVLEPALLTRMVFAVAINGVGTAPSAGTGIIAGDPESFFLAAVSGITIVQG